MRCDDNVKNCVKRPLSKRRQIGFKIFVLSIFEGPFYQVLLYLDDIFSVSHSISNKKII